MVKTKGLKHSHLWLQSFFNSSACNCFGGAVCTIGKTHEAPWEALRLLVYSLAYFIVASFLLETGLVPQFKYVTFRLFTCFFTIYGYISNSQRDQLPVGLIAQLVECFFSFLFSRWGENAWSQVINKYPKYFISVNSGFAFSLGGFAFTTRN